MSTNLFPSPKIDVLRWNASVAYVKCPYCEEIHRHGIALPGRRVSHCHPGGQYEFMFPIDNSCKLVGYEIDKRRAEFVNVGMHLGPGGGDIDSLAKDENELAELFRSRVRISATEQKSEPILNIHKDSREVISVTLLNGENIVQKKILSAISECVIGNLHAISQYLHKSVEKELFLHGKNETGDTTLIIAAAEKSHEMVSLLLQHGADANAINNDGRSALMEAALWGRIESVKALLKAHADKRFRDHDGLLAIDLAQPARKNEKERYWRSSNATAEKVPERDQERRHIVLLLGDLETEKQYRYTGPLSKSEQNKYSFSKSQAENSITLCGPICSYRVPHINKTAAILDRGDQFARIAATSGWGADALPLNNTTGPHWVKQVYYIASTIGHEFRDTPDPRWDQGKPGQYFASHAEKKLIAYFIDKHVFMPQDREPDQRLEDSIIEVEDLLAEGKHCSVAWSKVCDLEETKVKLDCQLFSADDLLLGGSYSEQEVNRLKYEIHVIDEKLSLLESDVNVVAMRAQKENKNMFLKRKKVHQELIELSRNKPPISLKRAVILSSNDICEDCEKFKKRVNNYFQLNIEMNWCI